MDIWSVMLPMQSVRLSAICRIEMLNEILNAIFFSWSLGEEMFILQVNSVECNSLK